MNKKKLLVSTLVLTLLSGCGTKDATEHYADALNFIQQHQYNAAIIELKSAIQQQPDNADFRMALGNLYLQTSDPLSAEKELSRALQLGTPVEQLAVALAKAHYLAENYQPLLSLFESDSTINTDVLAYVQLYKALAEIELGSMENAVAIFDQLIQADLADIKSFAEAALSINARSYDNARQKLNVIKNDSPIYLEALLLNAHTALMQKSPDTAAPLLLEYLQQRPSAYKVRLLTAETQVRLNDLAAADQHLQPLLKVIPNHGLTNYLKAVVEYDKKNYTLAKEHVDKAILAKLDTVPNRVLAGLIHYQLGLESQALVHLSAIKQYLPQLPEVNRLYAALRLKAGEVTDAAESISQSEFTAADLALVSSTVSELVRTGNNKAAADILARYEQFVVAEDAQSLQALGRLKLSISGQETAGIKALEQALLLEPGQHHTRLILAGNYIRLKQYDKASKLADEWISTTDTVAAGYNLKALVALLQQDIANGKLLLAQAQAADKDNVFTYFLLASVAQLEGDVSLADQYLKQAIALRPDYQPALASYYTSLNSQGKPEAAIQLIEQSQQKNQDNIQITLLLANVYQLNARYKDVITLLEPLANQQQKLPPAAYNLLLRAYAALSQIDPGVNLAQRWVNEDKQSLPANFAYASFLATARRYNDALRVLNNTLQQHPKNAVLLRTKMHTQAQLNDYQGALETFNLLPAEMKNSADMLFHQGRLQLLNDQLSIGINTLLKSYNIEASPVTATAIAEAYAKDVSYRKAVTFLEEHFAKHGENKRLRAFYANLLIQDDVNKAVAIYQKLVEDEPEDIITLNNYAWVLQQSGRTADALPYIEKAMQINANHPDILDSYGKILFSLGQYDKARAQYDKSLSIRPNNTEVQLNYAELLIKTTAYTEATALLNNIKTDDPLLVARKSTLLTSIP